MCFIWRKQTHFISDHKTKQKRIKSFTFCLIVIFVYYSLNIHFVLYKSHTNNLIFLIFKKDLKIKVSNKCFFTPKTNFKNFNKTYLRL